MKNWLKLESYPWWIVKYKVKAHYALDRVMARFGYYPDDPYHEVRRWIKFDLTDMVGLKEAELHEWTVWHMSLKEAIIRELREELTEYRQAEYSRLINSAIPRTTHKVTTLPDTETESRADYQAGLDVETSKKKLEELTRGKK